MAELKKQDLTKIMRGVPVRIYLDLTFDADGKVHNLGADGSVVIADHPNGAEVGFTQDGAELTRSVTREGLPVDQSLTEKLISITGQVPHLKFGALEVLDFETLQKLVPGSTYIEDDESEGISDQNDPTIEMHSITAIAPMNSDKTRHQVLIIYYCSNIADMALKLSKSFHKMPVDFQGEDAGRADGKTWYAYATKAAA
jgi:hypothetical protein